MHHPLFNLIPPIVRARDYYLYDRSGRRFLDFYQDNGRALIGHRPSGLNKTVKSVLSKGLVASYPSGYHYRLIKALSALFPQCGEFRYYVSSTPVYEVLIRYGFHGEPNDLPDPVLEDVSRANISLWRPFLSEKTVNIPVVVPILPFSLGTGITVFCFHTRPEPELPPSDAVPAVLLAGLCKSVYLCIKHIHAVDTAVWEQFDAPFWRREGPYLKPVCEEADYPDMFRDFLAHNIILSPFFPGPSVIPGVFTEGDIKGLRQLRRNYP